MKDISVEEMGILYWRRLRRGAIKEVENRLAQLKNSSPKTLRYWLAVHEWLERKALSNERVSK